MCCSIKERGPCILVMLTVLVVLIVLGYSVLYTVVYKMWYPDMQITPSELY